MVTGGLGHRGTHALLPAAVAYKFVSVSAMIPNQNMVEKSVLVMPKTSRCAITNPAQLVRQLLYLSPSTKKMTDLVLLLHILMHLNSSLIVLLLSY